MAIIGFVGQKHCGKTTACNIIKKHLPDAVQINFKDALVKEIKDNFPTLLQVMLEQYNDAYGPDLTIDKLFVLKPPLVRALLQNYGTEVRRNENPYYWTRRWKEKVYNATRKEDVPIVVDDVRFQNEADTVKAHKGILVRLTRSDILTNDDLHASEQEQESIECDYVITVGKGEFEKLEERLLEIIK